MAHAWPRKPEVSVLEVARHFAKALHDENDKNLTKRQHQEEGKQVLGHLIAHQQLEISAATSIVSDDVGRR